MSIASVTATTGVNGANANTTTAKGWGDMGAEDFIKLLTTFTLWLRRHFQKNSLISGTFGPAMYSTARS